MSRTNIINWSKGALIATAVLGLSQGWDMVKAMVEVSNTPAQQKIIKDRLDVFQNATTENFQQMKQQLDGHTAALNQMAAGLSAMTNQLDYMNSTLRSLSDTVKLKQ